MFRSGSNNTPSFMKNRSISRSTKHDETGVDPNKSTSLIEFVTEPRDNDFLQANPDYFTDTVNKKYISIRNKRPSNSNSILGELESTRTAANKSTKKEEKCEKKRQMP